MSGSHAGRPSSWAVVAVSFTGFTIGGVALCLGPNWFLFWAGVAVVVVSGVLGLAVGILSDVVLDEPRVAPVGVGGVVGGSRAGLPMKSDPEDQPHG